MGGLTPLPGTATRMRTSLYADDVVIFINPARQEIGELLEILWHFGEATGLRVNLAKSSAVLICCNNIDLPTVLHNFGGAMAALPIRYLGLPIMIGRIR